MAVQIPDPGKGDNQTGDNEYVFRKKVKDNFSDQTNAASRLVGPNDNELIEAGKVYTHVFSSVNTTAVPAGADINNAPFGITAHSSTSLNTPPGAAANNILTLKGFASSKIQLALPYGQGSAGKMYMRSVLTNEWAAWTTFYTTGNTLKDSNGFIKAASPTVKVFADKVELNDDAVDQNVTYKKNGVGDYTITTVSGLSTDGWYIELPKDMNGNPKVAVTLEETDGVISLKSYKRIFSMETFTFVPDLNEPLDIPDNRWIDLRLNEIPVEMPDDIQTEV